MLLGWRACKLCMPGMGLLHFGTSAAMQPSQSDRSGRAVTCNDDI